MVLMMHKIQVQSKFRFFTLVALAVSCLGTSCSSKKEEPSGPPPVTVTTFEVKPQTIPAIFDYVGFAESSHLVEIRARVEGYLDKIAYIEGSFVHVGQLLFQLDPKPFIASLEQAKGMLAQEEALLWNAKVTTDRLTPLYKQNAISKRDLDNAIANQLSSEAKVQQAKAQVVIAELNLGYTTITSPVNGLAGRARFREGALITTGPNSSDLTTVTVFDPIWVYFSVSDSDFLRGIQQASKSQLVFPKDQNFNVQLVLADGSVYPEVGKVDFAAPIINQTTGTLEVRAVFSNPNAIIKPGQFVKARVSGATRPNAIVIPQTAVMQGKKGMYVFIVKDKKAVLTYVEPGEWFANYWIINSGLLPGDQVIVSGVNKVQPGSDVIVTKTTEFVMPEQKEVLTPTQRYGI